MALVLVPFLACLMSMASAGNFNRDVAITFGKHRAKILNAGKDLALALDNYSGSGFQSKNEYLFGRFDMQIKLVSGNSAGSVTTYYLSSQGDLHDEIDFEFLGNVSGQPYTVHTNVFAQGQGGREQQFTLWFDPAARFHTYTILWNPQRIIFLVDNIPLRVFNNHEEKDGVPYPKNQPMRMYSSLWNADDWATQGGRVKANWTNAPFTASYRNINIDANCVVSPSFSCEPKSADLYKTQTWLTQGLDAAGRNRIRWVRRKHMNYNYCSDVKRFPQGFPTECKRPIFY